MKVTIEVDHEVVTLETKDTSGTWPELLNMLFHATRSIYTYLELQDFAEHYACELPTSTTNEDILLDADSHSKESKDE